MSIRLSLLVSVVDRYGSTVIQFATSLILARLLSPSEVGIFSVGAVVVSISHTLRDFGVSNYLIQEKELTRDRLRTAQGLTVAVGWFLAIALFVLSAPLASFYGEPGVEAVLGLLSVNFLVLPFGSVTAALLRRKMRFGILLRANLASAFAQSAVSIWLASKGFGPMSLAWGGVASVIAATTVTVASREPDQPWLPGISEWRRVVAKSSQFSVASLFYEVGLGMPELLTGKILGFHTVGILSRASGAVLLVQRIVVDAIQPVALPYFAERLRSREGVADTYLRAITLMTGITWSALAMLAAGAETIVAFLYGDRWLEAVTPLQILCLGMAMMTLTSASSAVLAASGQARAMLSIQAVGQSAKVLCVLALASHGLAFVAVAMVIGDAIIAAGYTKGAIRLVGVGYQTLLHGMARSIPSAVFCGAACALSIRVSVHLGTAPRMAVLVAAGAVGWMAGLLLSRHPLLTEAQRVLVWLRRRRA